MTLIGILHALGSRSAIFSLALAPWLLAIGCDHGARPSARAEERGDVGDGTPGAQSQPSGGAHDTLPEDTIGFEFAVVRRGPSESSLEDYLDVLRRHIELLPLFELVRIDAENEETVYIWVQPRTENRAEIKDFLCGVLQRRPALEFRILAERSTESRAEYDQLRRHLHEKGPERAPRDEFGWFKLDDPVTFFDLKTPGDLEDFDPRSARHVVEKRGDDYYVLAKLSAKDGLLANEEEWFVRRAYPDRDAAGRWCVSFDLNEAGRRSLEELTRRNMGRPLCILIDDRAIAAPTIQSVIREGVQITGDLSHEKISDLLNALQANAGPFRLKFLRTID